MRITVIAMAAALLFTACKGKSQREKLGSMSRTEQCDFVVGQSITAAALLMIGLAGELEQEGTGVAQVKRCVIENTKDPTRCLDDEMAAEIRKMKVELMASCQTWPDKVFDCIARNDESSPECVEALAVVSGEAPARPRPKAPAGPAVAWDVELGDDVNVLRLDPEGTLFVRDGESVAALRGGKELWKREMIPRHWLLVGAAVVLAADNDGTVYALDKSTGETRWTVQMPRSRDEDLDTRSRAQVAAFDSDGQAVLVDDEARFFRLDVAGCTARPKKCALTPAGALDAEEIDYDTGFFIAGDGKRYLRETGVLRAFDRDMKELFALAALDTMADGVAILGENRIGVHVDDTTAVLDVAACEAGERFTVDGRKQSAYGECSECGELPPGCVVATRKDDDLGFEPPTALGPEQIAFNEDETVSLQGGKEVWRVNIGAMGLLADGDELFALCSAESESDPALSVRALAAKDGSSLWETELPVEHEGWIYSIDDVRLLRAGRWLLAGYERHVAVIQLAE